MKQCSKCLLEKPLNDFYKNSGRVCKSCYRERKNKWRAENAEKARAAVHKWRMKPGSLEKQRISVRNWCENNKDRHKEIQRKNHLKRDYNLSIEDYQQMYELQEGKCSICLEWHDLLCVDHDHLTGQVRQLLCRRCNAAIGSLEEDVRLLQRAIDYLIKWRTKAQSLMPVMSDTADTYGHLDL